jgi:3-hydroxyacyl-CoA dehydrogenase
MSDVVSYAREGNIAVITIDNPPVNAMSHAVRLGLWNAIDRLAADADADAAVLICAGRTFVAGADIAEFDKPIQDPWLPALVQKLEDCAKPVVAAIHGTALGGGLETAMGCHFRCAVPAAKVGLPEVNLGLLPGASGTQRLPRLAGVEKALDMMISGKPVGAAEAKQHGIIDEIVDGDLRAGALACAARLLAERRPLRRLSREPLQAPDATAEFFAAFRRRIARQARGYFAPEQIVKCVEAAVSLPYAEALKRERELFDQCKKSTHSASQRYLFFAEREVAKIPDIGRDVTPRRIDSVAVIGAGTMGSGISMNFLNAGIPVTLLEMDRSGLDRGLAAIRAGYEGNVKKGRMTAEQMEKTLALVRPSLDYGDVAGADLVVEAVFENMAIKKEVFATLDAACRPGAILASNTSTLDLDEIAAVTRRPGDVIGLHFFAPANVMQLLEIVRGRRTEKDVVATAMDLAKRIRKVGVLVGVCFGFVGNRVFFPYVREAQRMVLEGVPPERIDRVAYDWGMAMGPNAVLDLSGVDVFQKLFSEWKDRPADPAFCRLIAVLTEMGRLGQKTGRGFYRYEGREAVPDPEIMELARREAAALGIEPRTIDDGEFEERLFCAMINEGARVLEEGIALRPGDVDVIFANGYGFPRWRGGPMFYADTIGLRRVCDAIGKYRARYGDLYWTPSPLLETLARQGSTFAAWAKSRAGSAG